MGLLTVIRKTKRKEREVRLLLLGLDNAGKTTIVRHLTKQDTSTVSPTLGFQISVLRYGPYTLNIWDVGGQKSLRSYWRNYFEETDGLLWVVDSNDYARLATVKEELSKLLLEERLAGASLLVMLNKHDIPTALNVEQLKEILDVEGIVAGKRHVHLQTCSAITGEGLLEGIKWMVDDIAKRLYL